MWFNLFLYFLYVSIDSCEFVLILMVNSLFLCFIDVKIPMVIQDFLFSFFSLQVMLHNGACNCKVVSNMLINVVIDSFTGMLDVR